MKKLLEDGEYDKAIEKTSSLIASETDEDRIEQLHQLRCELYYNNGNYEEAAEEAEVCLKDLIMAPSTDTFLFTYISAISNMHISSPMSSTT